MLMKIKGDDMYFNTDAILSMFTQDVPELGWCAVYVLSGRAAPHHIFEPFVSEDAAAFRLQEVKDMIDYGPGYEDTKLLEAPSEKEEVEEGGGTGPV